MTTDISPRLQQDTEHGMDEQGPSNPSPDQPPVDRRLRILCLHGYGGSGSTFRTKLSHLFPVLSDYADCIFVDGPSDKDPGYAWWHARNNDGIVTYEGWDTARETMIRIFDEQGPFDGVLGFSQGAIFTGLLSGLRHPIGQPSTPESPFAFSFAILISGFQARDQRLSTVYDNHELYRLPSLHVIGTADEIVLELDSMMLAERFAEPTIFYHEGAHIVPNDAQFKRTLGDFVKKQYDNKGARLEDEARNTSTSPVDHDHIEHSGAPKKAQASALLHHPTRLPSAGDHPAANVDPTARIEDLVIPLWSTTDSLTMRVVFPKARKTEAFPILVVFRGGGYATPRGSGGGTVEWAAARGFLAVEVDYGTAASERYYPDNYSDGARAVRLIKSRAKEWNANPEKLALLGYSAGGHLAALLSTRPEMYRHDDDDLFDKFSPRPSLLILAYGVLSFVDGYSPASYSNSVGNFFGTEGEVPLENRQQYSPEYLVDKETPPTFVWTIEPDDIVPPYHSKLFAEAMEKYGRDVEYTLYKTGYHAIGLAEGAGGDVEEWPEKMLRWIETRWIR